MADRTTSVTKAMAAAALTLAVGGCDQPGPLSAVRRAPPAPPPPAWAAALAGKPLKSAFPGEVRCLGSVDGVVERYSDGRKAHGWAWNLSLSRPIRRVAAVDAAGVMVGFGDGGTLRSDVAAARPEVGSPDTGWSVVAPAGRHAIYGLVRATGAACRIGEARF